MTLIRVRAWDEEDLAWLEHGLKTWPLGYDLPTVMQEIEDGFMQLWRMEDGAEGIVLTQIMQFPYGRKLEVKAVAGKGFIRKLNPIYQVLKAYGRECGCKWIGGDANSGTLTKVYERFGAKMMATNFLKEIADG